MLVPECDCADRISPTIDCPADRQLQCGDSDHPDATGWASASDNQGSVTVRYDDDRPDACGTIRRHWEAIDACGNVTTCTQFITVVDSIFPELSIPPDAQGPARAPQARTRPAGASAADNCGPVSLDYADHVVGHSNYCFELVRRWRVVDCGGNTVTGDQTIVIDDRLPPFLTCPPDARIICGQTTTPDALGFATATDDCAVETINFTDLPVLPHPDGCQFIRRWRAADACGNIAACDQLIVISGWDRTYGSVEDDDLRAVARTADGFLLAGSVAGDFQAQRIRPDGTVIWAQTYGPGQVEGICARPDGFVLAGTSAGRMRTVKIAPGGSVLWDADFADAQTAAATTTAAGGCIVVGQSAAGWLALKLDPDGNEEWRREVAGDRIRAVAQTPDGGYLLGGGADDYTLVRLDATGAAAWRKTYGGVSFELLSDILPLADGGAFLGGSALLAPDGRGSFDYWLIRVDADGNALWDRLYGGNGSDELAVVRPTHDGHYILAGFADSAANGEKTEPSRGQADYWLVKIDETGSVLWDRTLGGASADRLRDLVVTPDGCYLAVGASDSDASSEKSEDRIGDRDYWAILVPECDCEDRIAPGIDCPPDQQIQCGASDHPDATGWASASDNKGKATLSWYDERPEPDACGLILRHWEARDDCGNLTICTQRITVVDGQAPELLCPPDRIVSCTDSLAPDQTGWATAIDNCGLATVTFEDNIDNEIVYRRWTAVDCGGNQSECTQRLQVVDDQPPQLIGVPPWRVFDVADCNAVPTPPTVTAEDDCDDQVTVKLLVTGDCEQGGNLISWLWSASDAAGNRIDAQVFIRVTNRGLALIDDQYDATEDEILTVAAPGLLDNDLNYDDKIPTLTVTPAAGTVTLAVDGSFIYEPDPNANGRDQFTYEIDGVTATVAIDVAAVGDAPALTKFDAQDATTAVADVSLDRDLALQLAATDADGDAIDGWLITGTDLVPATDDERWQATAPSAHLLADFVGTQRLYAWVRDASGAVSAPLARDIQFAPVQALTLRFANAEPADLRFGEWPFASDAVDAGLDEALTGDGAVYWLDADGNRLTTDLRPNRTRNRWLLEVVPGQLPIEIQPLAAGLDSRRVLIQRLDGEQPVGRAMDLVLGSRASTILTVRERTRFRVALAPEEEVTLAYAAGWSLVGFNLLRTTGALPSNIHVFTWRDGRFVRVTDAHFEAERAYWVYSPDGGVTPPLTGIRADGRIQLDEGWNMVSPARDTPVPDVVGFRVYAWNPATGVYMYLAPGAIIRVGVGYWVYTTRAMRFDTGE